MLVGGREGGRGIRSLYVTVFGKTNRLARTITYRVRAVIVIRA